MIYVRTLTRKLIRGISNGSRMYITSRLQKCKVWNRFISTFFVVAGTKKKSALSNHNLESFEDILQGFPVVRNIPNYPGTSSLGTQMNQNGMGLSESPNAF